MGHYFNADRIFACTYSNGKGCAVFIEWQYHLDTFYSMDKVGGIAAFIDIMGVVVYQGK